MRSLFGSHSDVHLAEIDGMSAHVLVKGLGEAWALLESDMWTGYRGRFAIELTAEATPTEHSISISVRHIESVGFAMAAASP
jgi:hypothetical protein